MANYIVSPATYLVEIRDQYGRVITTLTRPQQKQFSIYRNKPGSAQFILDLYDAQALPQYFVNSVNSIVFRRNLVPVFAGLITYHEPKIDDSDKQKEVDVTVTGYFDQLDYRIITSDYPNYDAVHNKLPYPPTDVGQIAWSLINYAQFPIPNSDDPSQSNVLLDGTYSIQQSFQASGTALLTQLKFVLQNGSIFTGRVSSTTNNTMTDNSQNWAVNSLQGGTVTITDGTDAGDQQTIASNTNTQITLYGNDLQFNGTVTSATNNTLTDTSQSWTPGSLVGGDITITNGTDAGDAFFIIANTNNTVTVSSNWTANPDGTSSYSIDTSIFNGGASSATLNTLTDTTQNWLTNALAGRALSIVAGTDMGDAATIISNTNNTVTISGEFLVQPDNTTIYQVIPHLTGLWSLNPDTSSTYAVVPAIPLTTGNLIVKLINDANGLPNGTVVPNSTKTIPVGQLPTGQLTWFEIDYSLTPGVSLTKNQIYWISVSLDSVQGQGNGVTMQMLSTAFYPRGRAYSIEKPTLFTADQDLQFFALLNDNSYQMTKNTYMGIQKGIIQPSFRLATSYQRYKHIKAAVEDLSTTYNGIDFSISVVIDPVTDYMTKFFNTYYPGIGQTNTSLSFNYPGNIKKMEKPKDGTTVVNEVFMYGRGRGANQLLDIQRDNTSIDTFGLRQKNVSQIDLADVQSLTTQALEYIRVNKDPSDLPAIYLDGNLPPTYGTYGIGDWIRVVVNDSRAPILAFNQQYRIEEIDVTIDDDGVEEIQINGSNI